MGLKLMCSDLDGFKVNVHAQHVGKQHWVGVEALIILSAYCYLLHLRVLVMCLSIMSSWKAPQSWKPISITRPGL